MSTTFVVPSGTQLGDTVYGPDEIPLHTHVYDWEWGEEYSIVGVQCSVSWLIQPGPRGKRPRIRICEYAYDLDQVLSMFVYAVPNTNRDVATIDQWLGRLK